MSLQPQQLRPLAASDSAASDPESSRDCAEGRLLACLTAPATGIRWTVFAFAIIALACGAVLQLGVPHAAIYGHDTFIVLDGGWRVLNGQRPHLDFYSAFGPVPYLIAAAGLKLAALRVEGLVYATAVTGAILGIWTWALVRTRLRAWPALLALAFLVLFWLAPFPYGEPFYLTGYAMQYNRLGYVLACLVLVELYAPGASQKGKLDGGISTGIAAGILCFLKISFFSAVCVLIASAYFLSAKRRSHFLSVLGGFALVAIPLLAYLHWNVAAMLRDLAMVAGARQVRFTQSYDPFRTIFRNLGTILALLGMAYLGWLFSKNTSSSHTFSHHPGLGRLSGALRGTFGLAAAVIVVDVILAMSNTQRQGFPLSLLATLILAHRVCDDFAARGDKAAALAGFAMATTILLMPTLTDTANGWGMVLRSNVLHGPGSSPARFDALPLAKLVLEDHDEPGVDPASHNGTLYVARVNEGLALLRRASTPQDSIACLCFANPFSYALLRPPATGGSTFFAYGVDITSRYAPSAARILGNAEVVIYPKAYPDDSDAETLLAIVRADLTRHYNFAAESPTWVLWKRK